MLLAQHVEQGYEDRFWTKVNRNGPLPDGRSYLGQCWVWLGWTGRGGYGVFDLPGRRRTVAHRVAYGLLVGSIPEGLELDHLCSNPGCVNPDHLETVTRRENIMRSRLPAVIRALKAKTHCKHGHDFSEENTYRRPTGRRECRICRRNHMRRYKERCN